MSVNVDFYFIDCSNKYFTRILSEFFYQTWAHQIDFYAKIKHAVINPGKSSTTRIITNVEMHSYSIQKPNPKPKPKK